MDVPSSRSIENIVTSVRVLEGGGFTVRRPIPNPEMDQIDPFLLLDQLAPTDWGPREAIGAPDHPHRGFETVTYLLAGKMRHEDNAGHGGVIEAGGIQWMTAGRGIIHCEEPHEEILRDGGRTHGFQIWVNLPASHKMMRPRYQEVPSSESPTVEKNGVWARVIAGECMGEESAIDTKIPISLIHVKMNSGSRLSQELESGLNGMIYVFPGEIEI